MKKYNQHYVPRSILRNFVDVQSVFCLMKQQNGKIIGSSVENLCAEKSFYCFSLDIGDEDTGENLDYDKQVFDKIDGEIAPVIKKITEQHSVDTLNDDEKALLATYVVYQYMRSPAAKNIATGLSTSEKDARQIQGLNLLDREFLESMSCIIRNFTLKLVKAIHGVNFIISDSPVLWSPTAEGIYFPISPECCLCYQKVDTESLDPICINELEFLSSVKFNIAQSRNVLQHIWQKTYQKHISDFCQTGLPSYWKCILECKNSLHCINYFRDEIYEEFEVLMSQLRKN